jgi:hypothetical protein
MSSAKKYFLVDEDKYYSLIDKYDYDPEHLKIAQNNVKDILRNPNLNISSKNAYYNMALRDLIKKKKHVAEKPKKVEDTKLTDINANLNNTLKTLSNLLEKQKPLGIENQNERLINENYGISPKIQHLDSKSPLTPPDLSQEISSFSPLRTQKLDSDVSLKTPSNWKSADEPFLSDDTQDSNDPTSPLPDAHDPNFFNNLIARMDQTTPLSRNVRERVSQRDIDARKSEELAKHLLQTQEYGFKEDGQLISPKSKKNRKRK